MPSITLKARNKYGSYDEFEIPLQEWRLSRRSVRSKLEYKNGGGESVYHGFNYLLELRWQYLDAFEYVNIALALDAIRAGRTVQWLGASGLNYLGINFSTADPLFLDLESDDHIESAGEWVEKMPFEISFYVTRSVSGEHNSA